MDLKQLEYFINVAEHGSFSKAALVLQIAQPALSRQVRALEIELRETLLLRNGRGVALTEAGQRLMEHGRAILQLVEQRATTWAPGATNRWATSWRPCRRRWHACTPLP
ncbi:LysR family transcriptional regulator [Roseateles sp. GG27B]